MNPVIRIFLVYLFLGDFFYFGLLRTYFNLPSGPWLWAGVAFNSLLIGLFCYIAGSMKKDLLGSLGLAVLSLSVGSWVVQNGWLHFNLGYAVIVSSFFAMVANVAVSVARSAGSTTAN